MGAFDGWTRERVEALLKKNGQVSLASAPSAPPPAAAPQRSALETRFEQMWTHIEGPPFVAELETVDGRNFRFDFAWPLDRIAVELEGTTRQGGRHQRKDGFESDCHKYLAASLAGWTIFRLTRRMITDTALMQIKNFVLARQVLRKSQDS